MSLTTRVTTLALLAAVTAPAAAATASIPLARVAAENGYVYTWIASEGAVTLARPGVTIVLRAGQSLYRVGDRILSADRAPEYDGTDLVVTPAVAAMLRRIAQANPLPAPPAFMPAPPTSGTGALTVEARPLAGRDAIAVRGRGPADVPVTVTLTGEISRDLPVVVLSRTATRTAKDGTYTVEVGLVAGPGRDTKVVATVTSLPGVRSASTTLIVGETSPFVDSPLDKLPQ